MISKPTGILKRNRRERKVEFNDLWDLPEGSSYKVSKSKSGLILELHLIPRSSFGSNLRNQLGRKWDTLSKKIRSERGFKCDLCRASKKKTHLHEVWEYNEETKIQKLIGFECVCENCHSVHHWGYSEIQNKNMEFLINHACHVNSCKKKEFEKHIEEASEIWRRRSNIKWTLNIDLMNYL